MSWIFRKIFRFGPFRTTLSKGGVGMSWGIPGFRIGVSPTGRKYLSIGIPGTGLYFLKYLSSEQKLQKERQKTIQETITTQNNMNQQPWWKQKNI
ncbi:MAG: DUF4236 domain-containing protein [Bacteroidetes bacterium]|jgi:hypothetical protein|nr:DUF4236 domain-containing protein [Bacteroidota bacterium]MCC7444803.1 DUF4236 domain-containing protein [Saprospiraceae bacterium]HRO08954.1 DUF4236 domain-containing protein [Saprospiraceae bacterium]HRP42182.1 DUF4236 domain-containing protein [Saprospiraceae bacterium]